MLVATVLAIFFVPLFYVLVEAPAPWRRKKALVTAAEKVTT